MRALARPARVSLLIVAASVVTAAWLPSAGAAPAPLITRADLDNGGRPCTASQGDLPLRLGYFADRLEATAQVRDTRPPGDYTFAIWPVGRRAATTTFTARSYSDEQVGRATVPDGVLQDGGRYAWQARYTGDAGTSAWSPICFFTVDRSNPPAPVVTSSNYPVQGQPGPGGEPVHFTFSGHGDGDVRAYQYDWGTDLGLPVCSEYAGPQAQLVCPDPLAGDDIAVPDRPGADLSVTLSPPGAGPQTLSVRTIDAAGNVSPTVRYQLFVPSSAPVVARVGAASVCGPRVRLRFTPGPGVHDVVSYSYSLGDDVVHQVTATRSGAASALVRLQGDEERLVVRSTSTDGYVSTPAYEFLQVAPTPQVVASNYPDDGLPHGGVGTPGTFSLYPASGDYPPPAYSYRFSDGTTGTVTADPDYGTAQLAWTPAATGPVTLAFTETDAAGRPLSCGATYSFVVAG